MSNHSTVDWKSFCSEVCEHWLENRDPIGGKNVAVEIGETLIIRRKLERGGRMFSQVLFGGIERVSKRRFVVGLTGPNDRRDEQTLLPLNKDFVLPVSIIYSDWWKAYENLSSLYVHHHHHDTVNFVDGQDASVHTQNIKRLWLDIKQWVREGLAFVRHVCTNIWPGIFL